MRYFLHPEHYTCTNKQYMLVEIGLPCTTISCLTSHSAINSFFSSASLHARTSTFNIENLTPSQFLMENRIHMPEIHMPERISPEQILDSEPHTNMLGNNLTLLVPSEPKEHLQYAKCMPSTNRKICTA